ncbi:hypothetical protein WJX74_007401 [Apatococcus lobatus]|uniref:G-patch domain-containing protein n=1 Tax=Apatococcus lobatus TaxID=904363 RepID=A0AAW1RJH3_9CHLO
MPRPDDEDVEDYIYLGTPLEEEVESRAGQHAKAVSDPGSTKSLPVWKQEVTDEEGRRRFHGAFTGGYSAGYYNSVGSAAGWAPSSFKSSREQRTQQRGQAVEDFMDEDELAEIRGAVAVQTTADFDTFGSAAAEAEKRRARADAAESSSQAPSLAAGPIIEELLAPVAESLGIRLLQKMGWRQGKGVGAALAASLRGEEPAGGQQRDSRWGHVQGVGVDNTPIYLLPPKQDAHGLGFDPFKAAAEFAKAKRDREASRMDVEGLRPAKRPRSVAFGTGALDEDDSYGITDNYVSTVERPSIASGLLHFEVAGSDDEDGLDIRPGRDTGPKRLGGVDPVLLLEERAHGKKPGALIAGFIPATSLAVPAHYPPPKVPPDFSAKHAFPAGASTGALGGDLSSGAPPPPPPSDAAQQAVIDKLAAFVARNGPAFEAIVMRNHAADTHFGFLQGGAGAAYFRWKVNTLKAGVYGGPARRSAPLEADERGRILGEQPLPTTARPATSAPQPAAAIPSASAPPGMASEAGIGPASNKADLSGIARSDRDRLRTSLAGTFTRGSTAATGTEAGLKPGLRIREPEAAPSPAAILADRFAPAELSTTPQEQATGAADAGSLQPAGASKGGQPGRERPKRNAQEWRPEPLLCKRLNVPDPFKGRPRELTMSRFRTDHLVLPDTDLEAAAPSTKPLPLPPPPAPPSALPTPSARDPTSQRPAAEIHEAAQVEPGAAAGVAQPQQAASRDVQDARALADSFLASLGLHAASLAEPPKAGPSADTGSTDPSPAASRSSLQGLPAAERQRLGEHVLPGTGPPGSAAVGVRGDEVNAPDVVTAAALERRAALHKSIFEGDMESESDDEEGDVDGGDTGPASAAAAGPQPPSASQQAPQPHPAVASDVPAAQTPEAGTVLSSALQQGCNDTAPVQQDAGGASHSLLGLPTGMSSRPVFMSKKARLAQAAALQQPAPPITATPLSPHPVTSHQPSDSRQQPTGPGREPSEGGLGLHQPSASRADTSSRPFRDMQPPNLHATPGEAGQSASQDVLQPPGVLVGAPELIASRRDDSRPYAPSAAVNGASSSGSEGADEDLGQGRASGGQPGAHTLREGAAGHAGDGRAGPATGAHVLGPPPGMSAIQWQRQQEVLLRDNSQGGKELGRDNGNDKFVLTAGSLEPPFGDLLTARKDSIATKLLSALLDRLCWLGKQPQCTPTFSRLVFCEKPNSEVINNAGVLKAKAEVRTQTATLERSCMMYSCSPGDEHG